jgi:hypothetical protein
MIRLGARQPCPFAPCRTQGREEKAIAIRGVAVEIGRPASDDSPGPASTASLTLQPDNASRTGWSKMMVLNGEPESEAAS